MRFNPAQEKAIQQTTGPLMVLAGPGTGKTRVIIQKILTAVQNGTPPERILAITFSNRATQEMLERLQVSSAKAAELVTISTIHSFCTQLVQRHGFRLGFHRPVSLMTESQTELLFRQLAHKLPLDQFIKTANIDAVLDPILDFISRAKDQGIWPEDLIELEDEWTALGDVYNAFQSFCLQKGLMDFGDAILFCHRLLKDFPEIRDQIQSSYDLILVDEFQDTNFAQVELLKFLAPKKGQISVVGDDDQSIYAFRGASHLGFQFFKAAFPEATEVSLSESYRLSPQIAETASALIAANGDHRFRPDKKIEARGDKAEPVQVLKLATFEDEALTVVERIEALLKSGTPPSEICVLARSYNHTELILTEARRRGLNFQSFGSQSLFDRPLIQDVIAFLHLLEDPKSTVDFLRLADSPFLRLPAEEIYQICKELSATRAMEIEKVCARDSLKTFMTSFVDLKAHFARRSLSETIFGILEVNEVVPHLMKNAPDDLKALASFHSQIADWEKIHDRKDASSLLPLLSRLFKNDESIESEAAEKAATHVSVMTVHASKGLEFDHVFVVGLVNRRFPLQFREPVWEIPERLRKDEKQTKEHHNQEERRLLYVAMTRARRALTLTTVEKKNVKPSSFLTADLLPLVESKKISLKEIPPKSEAEILKPKTEKPFERIKAAPQKEPAKTEGLSLSFTQLEKYEKCPQAYWFQYDLKIPTATTMALSLGVAIHSALENFYRGIQEGKKPQLEALLEFFEASIARELEQNPRLDAEVSEIGRRQLEKYFEAQNGDFNKPLALEENFKLKVGDHLIRGKIDRVDQGPEGITIIDYKTGKAKSEENEADQKAADKSLQLSIYALAAKECFNWNVHELKLYYLSESSTLTTRRNSKELASTKDEILSIAEQIRARNFEATPNQMICKYCEFVKICPSAIR